MNCEFLVRPLVGLSEFADTVLKNADYISANVNDFDISQIQRFLNKLEPLYPHLQILNRKDEVDGKILIDLSLYTIAFELHANILILIVVKCLCKMSLIVL